MRLPEDDKLVGTVRRIMRELDEERRHSHHNPARMVVAPPAAGDLRWAAFSGTPNLDTEEFNDYELFSMSDPADTLLTCVVPGSYLVNVVVDGGNNSSIDSLSYDVWTPGQTHGRVGGILVNGGEGQYTGGHAWGGALSFAEGNSLLVDVIAGQANMIKVAVLYLGPYEGFGVG